MFRLGSKLAQRSTAATKLPLATRAYITHIPRVSSMSSNTSTHEHAQVETFAGDIVFNEDIAMERFHEKAIASDAMRAAADHEQVRVVPSASSSYQNINVVYGQ
ncbi:hypothetical protein IW140_006150 [Coemansia sp. RSA 1813]|nr:hypothetical protein EV178_002452 [Coemansia sp. RSA 1646]KAJ1766689.1 hypothetical protein LPJ74_005755 [Coemansia sp. RSA 1843]KAJ2085782.1 hypothetical protein IW138_006118 [Coemansia sp. RSA 986]KAJ2211918.1 hypothetical protein EV179_005088 [Coemansia sp. RSA 487]KAJ2563337.1 hypothetical protein IW140_006150 [Coemansia sp. RSA 1813]